MTAFSEPVRCAALLRRALAALAFLAIAGAAAAQEAATPNDPLRVGVVERAPFAMQSSDGSWQGIAIDLWRMMAEDVGLAYELAPVDREGAVAGVAAGELDVALPVDATPDGEGEVDFLVPFHTGTLALASEREVAIWGVMKSLLSMEFLRIVLYLSLLLLAVGAVVWLIERRKNEEQFHRRPLLGLGDGFWWAGVTLTTIGYGDKAPVTALGRAVAMLWMLMGLAVSAALTASVISAVDLQKGELTIPSDLEDHTVAVRENSSTAAYLEGLGVSVLPVGDFGSAFAALRDGSADVIAGGAPELRTSLDASDADLAVTTTRQDPHYVTLALANDADPQLVEALSRSLLERITTDEWWTLTERYLPSGD